MKCLYLPSPIYLYGNVSGSVIDLFVCKKDKMRNRNRDGESGYITIEFEFVICVGGYDIDYSMKWTIGSGTGLLFG